MVAITVFLVLGRVTVLPSILIHALAELFFTVYTNRAAHDLAHTRFVPGEAPWDGWVRAARVHAGGRPSIVQDRGGLDVMSKTADDNDVWRTVGSVRREP